MFATQPAATPETAAVQPRNHPLLHSHHVQCPEGLPGAGGSHANLCSAGHSPCVGSHRYSAPPLPKGFALCLMPDAHTALCKQNQHNLSIFFFKKDSPFPLGSSPAPTELREMGLVLICRHELIADELWQLFQEGVCKVISAIKPLWVGCDYFFLPSSFCIYIVALICKFPMPP